MVCPNTLTATFAGEPDLLTGSPDKKKRKPKNENNAPIISQAGFTLFVGRGAQQGIQCVPVHRFRSKLGQFGPETEPKMHRRCVKPATLRAGHIRVMRIRNPYPICNSVNSTKKLVNWDLIKVCFWFYYCLKYATSLPQTLGGTVCKRRGACCTFGGPGLWSCYNIYCLYHIINLSNCTPLLTSGTAYSTTKALLHFFRLSTRFVIPRSWMPPLTIKKWISEITHLQSMEELIVQVTS